MVSTINGKLVIEPSTSFDFKQFYDPNGLSDNENENYPDMLPTFYRTIFEKIQYNKYNDELVNLYDINKYKLLFMNKKYKNKFINTHIKNQNYNKYTPLQQICSLKKLSKSYSLSHLNFHYYIHHIIAEIYIKMKDYKKSIEHYLLAKQLLITYENNVNILKFEQKYNTKCEKYICLNSKNVFDISFNIGLLHLYINKFDDALEYFIHPYNYHKKSNQILIVLLLKYYYKFLHNNTIKLAVHFNKYVINIIHHTDNIDKYKEHYIIGFLYYILHEPPYLYLAIKHLEQSSVYYPDANHLLGNIYNETGYYYNIYKSLTYYNSIKKLNKNKNNKLSITLNKLYLQIDIQNYHKLNKFNIYFKYLYNNIIQNWKHNKNICYTKYNIIITNYNFNDRKIIKNIINSKVIETNNINDMINIETIKKFNKLHIYFKYLYYRIIMNWKYNNISNIMNSIFMINISNIFYNYWFSEIIRKWRINWLLN